MCTNKLFDALGKNCTLLQLESACRWEIVKKNTNLLPSSGLPCHEMADATQACEGAVGFCCARGRAQPVVCTLMGASGEEEGGRHPGLGDSGLAFPEG